MSIILLLAVQAAGQEVTTFYPLPPQQKQEQAQTQDRDQPASAASQGAKPVPNPAKAEQIEVLSVKAVPPDANVMFVPDARPPH
jgi:hypothetical protein